MSSMQSGSFSTGSASRRGFLGASAVGFAGAVLPGSLVHADSQASAGIDSGLTPPLTSIVEASTGQRIFVGEWPALSAAESKCPIVFAPGLTSHHRGIGAVAWALCGKRRVISLDLRGRGNSSKPGEGQYGMQRHAEDLIAVMDALGIERAVIAGHSMGAYVATAAVVHAPDRAAGLVLIDGGIVFGAFIAMKPDADALLKQTLGPVVDRLATTYTTADELRAAWRATGHLPDDAIGHDYIDYDIEAVKGGYRSKCSPVAVREDWRDMVNNMESATRIERVKCPVMAVAAEFGIGEGTLPILPPIGLARLQQAVGDHKVLQVPGTTHYTCVLSRTGADIVAAGLAEFVAPLR